MSADADSTSTSTSTSTEAVVLRASVLGGLRHGFSTRLGGVSVGRYASLNLSAGWGDEADAVAENRRRLAAAIGYAPARLCTVKQVHGTDVVDAEAPPELPTEDDGRPQADAVLTVARGRAVGVYTADCVPVLLAHPATGAVCAVHAGWRGAAAGIVTRAALMLAARVGAAASELRAALGPSIGPCCFEVGCEVVAAFAQRHGETLERPGKPDGNGNPRLDLWRAVVLDLLRAGLPERSIGAAGDGDGAVPPCTACDPGRFFSYRRDGRAIGQQLSVIVSAD